MKKYCFFLLVLPLLGSSPCFSQSQDTDFSSVDSFAAKVKYHGDLTALTRTLTDPYTKQLYKARAIFIWITDNIEYDCKDFNRHELRGKPYPEFKCKNEEDCEAKKENRETNYLDRVLKRKKAVCHGYASLFKRMCDIAGLKAEYIKGYTRSQYYQVGQTGPDNHAWNSILIDSTYYLLDATWAAGGCLQDDNGKLTDFFSSLNEYYWLTSPRDFVRDHFPENPRWTLIPNYTIENYADNPYYEGSELSNLTLIKPDSGIIHAKKGDTIRFKINYTATFDHLQINSNVFHNPDIYVMEGRSKRKQHRVLDTAAVRMQQYVPYRHEGFLLEFEYVVTDNSLYYLDIVCDRERIMRFNVKTTE